MIEMIDEKIREEEEEQYFESFGDYADMDFENAIVFEGKIYDEDGETLYE